MNRALARHGDRNDDQQSNVSRREASPPAEDEPQGGEDDAEVGAVIFCFFFGHDWEQLDDGTLICDVCGKVVR